MLNPTFHSISTDLDKKPSYVVELQNIFILESRLPNEFAKIAHVNSKMWLKST
jgi:hypothetical protein